MSDQLSNNDHKLRVGLLVDSFEVPAWIASIVEDIQSSSVAYVTLVVKNKSGQSDKSSNILRRIYHRRNSLVQIAYCRLDDRLFSAPFDAFAPQNIHDMLHGCPIVEITPRMTKFSDYFEIHDVERILEHQLDVVLRFGFRILRGTVLRIAKYGVWSYHHADSLVNRGGPPCFWEVMERHPVTGSILQILTEDLDGGKVLYRSYASTDKRSVRRNKNNCYWKSAKFVIRKISQLHEEGGSALDSDIYEDDWIPYSNRLYRNPGNIQMSKLLLRHSATYARDKIYRLFNFDQWGLFYHIGRGDKSPYKTIHRYKAIVPPKDRFWADCFPVMKDNRYYLFVEEFVYKNGKGHISVIEMDNEGNCRQPEIVLERSYHLSYPFIFQHDGEYYMIPETSENRTVEIYRCISFPDRWELVDTLLEDMRAADATIEMIDGHYWMFVNIADDNTPVNNDELYLYHSDDPMGPWLPHRKNPIKSDTRGARPAGHLFKYKGKYYRPAQDCSVCYGYAISINRIERITETEYSEVEVAKMLPEWSKHLVATHTINQAGNLTVIDAMVKRRKLSRSNGKGLT